jgi:hypothetical protein
LHSVHCAGNDEKAIEAARLFETPRHIPYIAYAKIRAQPVAQPQGICTFHLRGGKLKLEAKVAELADAPDLGPQFQSFALPRTEAHGLS